MAAMSTALAWEVMFLRTMSDWDTSTAEKISHCDSSLQQCIAVEQP